MGDAAEGTACGRGCRRPTQVVAGEYFEFNSFLNEALVLLLTLLFAQP